MLVPAKTQAEPQEPLQSKEAKPGLNRMLLSKQLKAKVQIPLSRSLAKAPVQK
jgi:hypothetical protein